jgi:hypothetical protein
VIECKDGRYRALPIDQALERLEHLWDHDPDPFARHLTSQSVV